MTVSEADQRRSERKSLRDFGLTVGIAFGVLAALLYWRGKAHYVYFVPVSAALIILGLIVPVVLGPIRKGWMAVAAALGFVMTRVILTILFVAVFIPIGVIAKLAGKAFLEIDIDRSKQTYWVYREAGESGPERLEKQF
jgi:hypothetical protein